MTTWLVIEFNDGSSDRTLVGDGTVQIDHSDPNNPLLKIFNSNTGIDRYIPYTSIKEFSYERGP